VPTDDQIIQRLRASLHRESAGIDLPPNLITTIRHELLTNTDPENRRRRARTPGAVFVGLTTAVALAVALIAIVLINHGHFAPHGEPATFAPGTAAIVAQTPDSQPGLPWGCEPSKRAETTCAFRSDDSRAERSARSARTARSQTTAGSIRSQAPMRGGVTASAMTHTATRS
jgi:hypothetical protein